MAATEDRLGVESLERRSSYFYHFDLASDEVLYANTLAKLNGSDELVTLTHSAGDDNSGDTPLAVLAHQDENEDPLSTNVIRDRGGTSPKAEVYENVVLELENDDADQTGYSLGSTAYAVDNETVSASQADGSAGSYAPVGSVVGFNTADDRIYVHVDGYING